MDTPSPASAEPNAPRASDAPQTLEARVEAGLNRPIMPAVKAFAEKLAHQEGALGVLFYGSNLRTGSLEGVLDFYVLLPGPQVERIWPRVSYHEWIYEGIPLRAKVATMALETFHNAAAGAFLDTTIWARFVQPSGLAWHRDAMAAQAITQAVSGAARTAARLAIALGPNSGTPEDYWRALFKATYAAEFRVEKAGREDSILSVNQEHFNGLLPQALTSAGIGFDDLGDGRLAPRLQADERQATLDWWNKRQKLGKPYNVARLLKASTTFEGAARYAAWKIERHTGVPVKVTPWREKHPVLSAPSVLFHVWRARKTATKP